MVEGELAPRNPTVAGLLGCCARAASGHAAAELAIPLMTSRRRTANPNSQNRTDKAQELQQGYVTSEMEFRDQIAGQQSRAADVAFGSIAGLR
jgi:hypothetical protein